MEKSTIHQLARSSSRQVSELAAGGSTVMLDLTREMTGIDHTPLITTKLHMPRPRAQLVSRSQLAERLQQGMTDALTLVSAPAGFGKTTVLAQWLAESGTPAAWLSLEPEDNERRWQFHSTSKYSKCGRHFFCPDSNSDCHHKW